jgi:Putative beta-barrel porin 2
MIMEIVDKRPHIQPIKGPFMAGMMIMLLCVAKDSYGWGKTRLGINLEQQVNAAGLKFGPFKIRAALFLPYAGYDSNVYQAPINPIEDFSITVGPGFDVYLPIKNMIVFSIFESPQYVYYRETKQLQGWNNFFNGQVHFVLNRFFITLGKGYIIARERWSTELNAQPLRKENSSQGSLYWQLSKKTSLFFRFSQATYDYEELTFGDLRLKHDLNRTESKTSITGYYQLSLRTMFFLNFEHGDFNFQYPLNPRDSRSNAIYGGFEFSPLGVFRGRINLGYKNFDALVAGIKDFRGIVGDTTISIRLLRFLTIRANYRGDVQFSAWYSNPYYLENIVGSGASLYLAKNIRLDYNFYFGKNTYPAAIGEQSAPQERQDDYTSQSVGPFIRIKDDIALGLIVTFWQRDSNIYWANGKQTLLGVKLIYDF